MRKKLLIILIIICSIGCSNEPEKYDIICDLSEVNFHRTHKDLSTFNFPEDEFLNHYFSAVIKIDFQDNKYIYKIHKITYVINNRYYPVLWFITENVPPKVFKNTSFLLRLPKTPILFMKMNLRESMENFDENAKKMCTKVAEDSFIIISMKNGQKIKVNYSPKKTIINYASYVYNGISY